MSKNRAWKKNKFIWKRRNSKWGKIYVCEIGWIHRANPESYWVKGKASYWWGVIEKPFGYAFLAKDKAHEMGDCRSAKDAMKLVESAAYKEMKHCLTAGFGFKKDNPPLKAEIERILREHYGHNSIL